MAVYSHCLTTNLSAMRDKIGVTEIGLKYVTDVGIAQKQWGKFQPAE